jgi:cytochrome c biogenesis protein CcmG/thiol:disulfide interchange protein DsbE
MDRPPRLSMVHRRAAIALLPALLLAPLSSFALDKGDTAPAFSLTGPAGAVRLADYAGKVVYLDFWASWCGPCKQSFPWMNEMQARYQGAGLRVVAINLDKRPADMARFLERTPAAFVLAADADGQVPKAYGVKAMPTSVLIGPDGRVIDVHSGFADDERAGRERGIRNALKLP